MGDTVVNMAGRVTSMASVFAQKDSKATTVVWRRVKLNRINAYLEYLVQKEMLVLNSN